MTAQKAAQTEPTTTPGAMAFDRFPGIATATGHKTTAGWAEQGGDQPLIEAD